ncbi:hypothetical protein BDB01DRAFT_527295 [Pilobolus umbonatus]|nr:hypothetical protein BDB01DRAFT_527295 [Pilobolus umbonatus]
MLVEDYDTPPPEDILPPYECTVYKAGYLKVLLEKDKTGLMTNAGESILYFVLRGTFLCAYLRAEDEYPLFKASMYKARCGIALDSCYAPHIIRIRFKSMDRYLIRPMGHIIQTISWMEHFMCAINISSDLDRMKMPHIIQIARPLDHTRRKGNTVTVEINKHSVVIPIYQVTSSPLNQN